MRLRGGHVFDLVADVRDPSSRNAPIAFNYMYPKRKMMTLRVEAEDHVQFSCCSLLYSVLVVFLCDESFSDRSCAGVQLHVGAGPSLQPHQKINDHNLLHTSDPEIQHALTRHLPNNSLLKREVAY